MSRLVFLLFIVLIYSCGSKTNQLSYYEDSGEVFHTYYHIKYEYERPLTNEILQELDKFNASLNPFYENSIIAKVNRNEEVELDSFFTEVFLRSMEISEKTDGMFDITCAPFVNLWGFGFQNMPHVSSISIDSIKHFVGYQKVRLINNRIVKEDARLILNTSAIAKGYSCDVVCSLLNRFGVKNYMCEIGGEVRAKGVNKAGECWKIGINKPIDDSTGFTSDIQTVIQICDKSIATSGNYRNYYIKEGKKYAHTINPKTGYPSEEDVLSATVLADDCMTADAYATAFMALGMKKAKALADQIENLHYYFIYTEENGNISVSCSEGFEDFFLKK